MGADLYESYSNAIVATFAIGVGAGYGNLGLLLPILLAVVGIIASMIGTFFVRTKEQADQKTLLHSLHSGTFIAGGLSAVASLPIIALVAQSSPVMASNAWGIFGAVICGIIAGFLIGFFTEYFTSDHYKPTRELSQSSETGTATVMIGGLSLGMKATAGPILTISIAVMISYFISGGHTSFGAGLYGIGIAAVGMLATLGINLACDAFGPVADNAGGIAEMAHLPAEVRKRTDALDALGNTTAATGKGFAIGSTAFTSLALLVSYVNVARERLEQDGRELVISLTHPPVLIGLCLGGALAFLFAALAISAVHHAAQSIVMEVRRQFREIKGLIEGTADADYGKCVDICTRAAQKEMIAPCLLAILSPVVVGFFLGAPGVIGVLTGVIVTGFPLAVFMMTSGGSWDNAKKHIEGGRFGGKGSESHKAAVIGDTVGDPLKDTAGPSFNILITLASTVAIVFVSITVAFSVI
jgi:K(+)-stimulated pyrophosphate-energized sodium pump